MQALHILLQLTGGIGQRPLHVIEQLHDGKVHLHDRVALFLNALLQNRAHPLAVRLAVGVRVAVDPDLIPELAAQQLICRNTIRLAGQIPQRHLNTADAAGLVRVIAELLDAAENLVHIAGVLTQQQTLEHQRVYPAAALAHLAVTLQALVGDELDDGRAEGRLQIADLHVHDFQIRRTGAAPDVLKRFLIQMIFLHGNPSFFPSMFCRRLRFPPPDTGTAARTRASAPCL